MKQNLLQYINFVLMINQDTARKHAVVWDYLIQIDDYDVKTNYGQIIIIEAIKQKSI